MKKIISLFIVIAASTMSYAQDAKDLAKKQMELNEINMKLINAKPTKEAKKQAKVLTRQGWEVPAGQPSIERQITKMQLYQAELMTDGNGNPTTRYITHSAQQTAGTYNAGYAAARATAQAEVASTIKTSIFSTLDMALGNNQGDAVTAASVDVLKTKTKMIVDEVLTGSIPLLVAYRRLPNNNFEVQFGLAYDKMELSSRLKNKLLKELGDDSEALVDGMVNKAME